MTARKSLPSLPLGQVSVTLLNFCLAALMGVTLRSQFLFGLPFNYRFLTHAHSHLALLGWVYLIAFVFISHHFLAQSKIIRRLFALTQLAVVGMVISFPIQGYAPFSILFSTLHIFCSYAFAGLSWKKLRSQKSRASLLILTAFGFMNLSTLGVWALAPIMMQNGANTAAYHIAIQFFLHFQLSGWFWFTGLGIGWVYLEKQKKWMPEKAFRKFYLSAVLGALLTVAFPINEYAPHPVWFIINAIGVFFLVASVLMLFSFLSKNFSLTKAIPLTGRMLIGTVWLSIFLKVLIQLFGISSVIATSAMENQSWKIGYLHLFLLGVISSIFIYFIQKEMQIKSLYFLIGTRLFIVGYALTEILLFLEGWLIHLGQSSLPLFYESLWYLSIVLFLGVLGITLSVFSSKLLDINKQTGG